MEPSLREAIVNAVRQAGVDASAVETVADGVFVFRVPGGGRAVEIWKTLSAQSDSLGGWPVIVGDPQGFYIIKKALDRLTLDERKAELERVPAGRPGKALRSAELEQRIRMRDYFVKSGIEVPTWLSEYIAVAGAQASSAPAPEPTPDSFSVWSRTVDANDRQPESVNDLHGEPLPKCLLAIVAGAHAPDVPAMLGFGGFNSCPRPSIHVAYCRDWNQRFGAVPICVTHDVIELYVPRPPATPEETWEVACEQVEYCSDIVYQGTGSVEKLAESIWESNYWYFWWD